MTPDVLPDVLHGFLNSCGQQAGQYFELATTDSFQILPNSSVIISFCRESEYVYRLLRNPVGSHESRLCTEQIQ
jgi:hypothetical protein